MIVVDVETSGLFPEKNGIWQIGALDFYNPENSFLEEARIDDEDEITEEALRVIGKTALDLRDKAKQSQKQLLENFFNWSDSVKLKNCLCQNPQFDLPFISLKARKYSLEFPFHHRAFDLHSIAQVKYQELYGEFLIKDSHSDMGLSNILNLCGLEDKRIKMKEGKIIEDGTPHNALEDAGLTAECFSRLVYGKSLFSEFSQYKIPEYLIK